MKDLVMTKKILGMKFNRAMSIGKLKISQVKYVEKDYI